MQGFGGEVVQDCMENLRRILACNELARYQGESAANFEVLSSALDRVRPVAKELVEGFGMYDEEINSFLGRKDGRVYEEMLFQARKMNPVNKTRVFEGIREISKPKL